ncbi:MAG: peptidoglycan DD-metalloendopeptidase family protein [Actinomycetota bacterium]|nr:peptidoglycan DD-metalloendopeptidase family protein [Actinomycetota bacterium]
MLLSKSLPPIILLVILALFVVAPIPAGAQTKSDVDKAQAAQDRAYNQLLEANEAVGQALAELEAIDDELQALNYTITVLDRKIAEFDEQVAELKRSAQELVVEAYTNSGTGLVTAAFTAASIQDLLTSQTLIGHATERDLASLDLLTAVNRENDRLKAEVAEKRAEVEILQEKQKVLVERLANERAKADRIYAESQDKYKEAYAKYQAELRRRAEEEARRKREEAARQAAANNSSAAASSSAAAGVPVSNTPGVVCPVAGNSWFSNTWGAPRSGGRTHKGVDMMAGTGTKLVAMDSGKVRLNWHYAGGRQVYVYADNGMFYYYAHLSGYAPGLSNGQRVSKGQVIGYVGATGNASVPHLHLGMGPSSGVYVNPYPTVRRVC